MAIQTLEDLLVLNQALFAPVIPFDEKKDKLVALDFSAANKELHDEIITDTVRFSKYINDILASNQAKYGIGGYGENRALYARSALFDSSAEGEPRRIHLGTDIWGKQYTPVTAPWDGIIHSFSFNDGFGDYGATIILAHKMIDQSFFTLYGHLSLNSLRNLQEGQRVEKGEVFAEFGIPSENGHWPPHLHFQLIKDIQGKKGDYPGVCSDSEKEFYFNNCPDPDVILQLNQYLEN
jgi:murein DD-endopeptidase MepM/ murein hydrolase activator NlpD